MQGRDASLRRRVKAVVFPEQLEAGDAGESMNPLVTIIIPCYNAEKWVAEAVGSALAQTWKEIEVIAINDGSRDNSRAVLSGLSGPKVQVIDQPNRGASAARNAGIRSAKGKYIQFLDADDLLAPEKIAHQVSLLEAQASGALGSARWARFQGDPGQARVTESPLFADLASVDYLLLHTAGGYMMQPAAWLVPADVVAKAGPWDETLTVNDDGEYFARVVLAAGKIIHSPNSLSLYRSGLQASLSGRRDRRSLDSLYSSCEKIAAHLSGAEDSPRVRRALADYFQRLAYEIYPDAPDLFRLAESKVRALGGSSLRPAMGRRQAILSKLIGWKLARRATLRLPR
jgi:glycosyltransferase involved in cell wall biosynthesis